MIYRRFGRTGLDMSVLSAGGMRYQFFRRDLPRRLVPKRHQHHVDTIVDRALDYGINHFETARDYGTSEIQLGNSLRRHPRHCYLVQTKVMPCADPTAFRAAAERSLGNLGFERIDLLAIHGINTRELAEWTLRPGGCRDVAETLRQQGRVGAIGFSTHAPTPLIIEVIESGHFEFVNLHWYYINQSNWPAVEAATRTDLGVFVISPSDKGGHLYAPSPKLRELCRPLSPMAFNDVFCLSHGAVHTLSIGAVRPSDFDEHVDAAHQLSNAERLLPEIEGRLEQAAREALGDHWLETWREGLPTHEETPGGINIPVILWLRNLLLAYDMQSYARARYNLLGNGSHWFPGNNAARLDQFDLGPCLVRSPHAHCIPELLRDTHRRLAGRPVKRLSQGWFVRR